MKLFSFKRVLIPLLIGFSVAAYLIMKDFNEPVEQFDSVTGEMTLINQSDIISTIISNWTWYSTICLLIAMCCGVLRDLMYMYRIRLLSDKQLSWKQSFQVIMLWEFGSAVTPSVVGGSALAFFIVAKEGISVGRSTAIVMITALLDELFYIVVTPIVILLAGVGTVFITDFDFSMLGSTFGVKSIFAIGYGFMCLLTLFILVAIFIYPQGFRRLLCAMGSKRIFKRWQGKFNKMGEDIITSSQEFKGKGFKFWAKAYGCTLASWTSRFFVVNFILLAFSPVSNHFLVYARQLVMWIILCISPTPGSSGIAEFAFPIFLKEFLPLGTAASLSILWRVYTYYPYLLLGFMVLPLWTKRVFKKKK